MVDGEDATRVCFLCVRGDHTTLSERERERERTPTDRAEKGRWQMEKTQHVCAFSASVEITLRYPHSCKVHGMLPRMLCAVTLSPLSSTASLA